MNAIGKYSVILVIAIIASVSTSYATTTAILNSNIENGNIQSNSQQTTNPDTTSYPNNNVTETKIFPINYTAYFSINPTYPSNVIVYSDIPMNNLTIVYKYETWGGEIKIESIDYGNYYPTRNPNHAIEPHNDYCYQYYNVPKTITDSYKTIGRDPYIEILEVYGFS